MALPYFFVDQLSDKTVILDEDTSRHVISVLRMKKGDQILLTDGKGKKATGVIEDDNRKKCKVHISTILTQEEKKIKTAIGISLIKNASRFEWFLEKATEIGVSEIIPLLCERTEKEKFREERLLGILTSAMVQSQQCWMPRLFQPSLFSDVLQLPFERKYIAHCLEGEKSPLAGKNIQGSNSLLILIGPEGDFTSQELQSAFSQNFEAVTLGSNRLRTETAGVVAAVLISNNTL